MVAEVPWNAFSVNEVYPGQLGFELVIIDGFLGYCILRLVCTLFRLRNTRKRAPKPHSV